MSCRERISKGECLCSAILWTVTAVLSVAVAFRLLSANGLSDGKTVLLAAFLVMVNLASSGVHWYRWFSYDKKKSDDILGGNEYER